MSLYGTNIRLFFFGQQAQDLSQLKKAWMRFSIGIHKNNVEEAIKTYNLMSEGWFTHATPTLFNSGLKMQQLSSCFLIGMEDDSIEGIFNTIKDCALISKTAGGIGMHAHNIRAGGNGFGVAVTALDQGGAGVVRRPYFDLVGQLLRAEHAVWVTVH